MGYTKDGCLSLLKRKKAELEASGEERFPKRSDFTNEEVVAIKAFLGPWPRALEAAGIKPERGFDRLEKNRLKRARARRRRRRERKAGLLQNTPEHDDETVS